MIPHYPTKADGGEIPFDVATIEAKAVADYTGCTLMEAVDLDVFTFWGLLHDAVVYNKSQTAEGREWLRNAWRLTQTEPETEKLHKKYDRKGD